MTWEAVQFRRPRHTKRSISKRFESGLCYPDQTVSFVPVHICKSMDCLICYKQELESDTLFDWSSMKAF